MKVLNVTPVEAWAIQEAVWDCQVGRLFDDGRFIEFMRQFGVEPLQHYRLVVRRDVRTVPCEGVARIEEIPKLPT